MHCVPDEPDVVEAADVRMRHLASDAHLVAESHERRFVQLASREELQRNRLTENLVEGAIHFSHPALTDEAEDSVSAGQYGARRETPFLDGTGGGRTSSV